MKRAYILLQQEDIFHYHIVFSNKKTYSSPTRRHLLFSEEDIACLQNTHLGSKHIIEGPDLKKNDFSTLSQVHPMTFGLCLGIIADTF